MIVRPVGGGYRLPEHLRVTIGTAEENERFLAALARQPEGLMCFEARRHRRRPDRRLVRAGAEAGEAVRARRRRRAQRAPTCKLALERGIIDAIAPIAAAAARDADLVLVATPVAQFPSGIQAIAPH